MTSDPSTRFLVSIKAVLFTESGEVVLLRNDRDEWELPGGRLEAGETPEACVGREIEEELGVAARVDAILDSYLFEVVPDRWVFIVTYRCRTTGTFAPRMSSEHCAWGVFKVHELPVDLPEGYRNSIAAALKR